MTASAGTAPATRARATAGQRVRGRLLAGLSWLVRVLPEGPVDGLAGVIGSLWYRLAGERASLARRNLQRVVRYLAEEGLGSERVQAAARDGGDLERLLRATFRETARYYLDVARLPGRRPADLDRRLRIDTPELVERAFAEEAPLVLAAMHYGEVEFPAMLAVARTGRPVRAPMETIDDPALQDWIRRSRSAVGVEVVPLRNARKSLLDALASGQTVGLVADRNVAGGVVNVDFFGVTAPLPMGPALLAVESGRPLYLAAVRRIGGGRYSGALAPVEVPAEGNRRDRVEATMRNLTAAMERAIAEAPEQWWSLLSPIWPDLDPRASTGTGRLETETPS
jgi:KDO2-lipid IV(A) lauroyltransferase